MVFVPDWSYPTVTGVDPHTVSAAGHSPAAGLGLVHADDGCHGRTGGDGCDLPAYQRSARGHGHARVGPSRRHHDHACPCCPCCPSLGDDRSHARGAHLSGLVHNHHVPHVHHDSLYKIKAYALYEMSYHSYDTYIIIKGISLLNDL